MSAVLHETTVTATVWTVSSSPGGPYPASATRVHAMIAEANKILRQVAMKVVWNGTLGTANRADWYNLVITNRTTVPGTAARQLLDCSGGTGGVELYFVNSITYMGQAALGVNDDPGMALCADAGGHTLAHEILHQCGLNDIYTSTNGVESVSGPVDAGRLHADDWGGGYYQPGLTHADLITTRLLMGGFSVPASVAADIPYGKTYGYGAPAKQATHTELTMIPIGRMDMETRQPKHE